MTVHTSQTTRRVEILITVGYDYKVETITQIIQAALLPIEEIIDDPPPQVLCWELGATSLGLKVRWWIDSNRSGEVISRARAVQAIKEAFEANDVDPTDPQLIFYQNTEKPSVKKPQNNHIIDKKTLNESPPPPRVKMSKNDPESEPIKLDSKDDTMLAD